MREVHQDSADLVGFITTEDMNEALDRLSEELTNGREWYGEGERVLGFDSDEAANISMRSTDAEGNYGEDIYAVCRMDEPVFLFQGNTWPQFFVE